MGRIEALSHWVASDHFEELGRAEALAHGGFGMLTVGNLRKPRWWAMALLERLGGSRLDLDAHGDGAGGLVSALAARADDGEVGVLVWNSTLDQSRIQGDPLLTRDVTVEVVSLSAGRYTVRHWRVDEEHSNIFATWRELLGGADRAWPSGPEWDRLRERDVLAELEPARTVEVGPDGRLALTFTLPQPAISFLAVTPLTPSTETFRDR